jgi:F-type H+-transporting ATPase subunit delta
VTGALSIHYAEALAESVFKPESGLKPEEATDQLKLAESVIGSSKQLEIALLTPAISRTRKTAIVGKISDDLGLHRIIRNFLSVLVKHGRTKQLKAIRQSFELVVDERLGWEPAEITSAHELGPKEREEIERTLGTKLGKFIRAHYKVDNALLGGVRIKVGAKEYDSTLRGKLENMRQQLHISL